jgi:thiamine-phosphate pyrophosphorylase
MRAPPLSRLLISDQSRCPDWRAALAAAKHSAGSRARQSVGLILRDYDFPARAELAQDMATYCAREKLYFAIAGDARLAAKHGAAFHCPSYLLARPAARLGRALACDFAAVHNRAQLRQAAKAGFGNVFLSPVFATQSHIGAPPLGVIRARALAKLASHYGLRAYALGGMNEATWERLDGQSQAFQGFGAIDAFVTNPPAP